MKTIALGLKKKLKEKGAQVLIAEFEGMAIGTVRVETRGGRPTMSWTINPAKRGCGFGKKMVSQFVAERGDKVFAEVKTRNKGSIIIAEAAGFLKDKIEGELIFYSTPG